MDYVWRSLTHPDIPAWSALTFAVDAADDTGRSYLPEDLAEEFDDPAIDRERDFVGVWLGDQLVAAGQVLPPVLRADGEVRAVFLGDVHPEHRGRGIGAELLSRLEARTVSVARDHFPDRPIHPSTDALSTAIDAIALLEDHGYRPVRYFREMRRQLADLVRVPECVHPDAAHAVGVSGYRPELDEAVRAAHCAAFADHWGAAPPDADRWRVHYTGSRTFRPGCSVVSTCADGGVSGYVLCYEYEPGQIVLGQVGVRPEFRRRGLGRRLLCRCLVEAALAGYREALLDVDSANADGAGPLYESVGFQPVRYPVIYGRDLPA